MHHAQFFKAVLGESDIPPPCSKQPLSVPPCPVKSLVPSNEGGGPAPPDLISDSEGGGGTRIP